MTTPLVSVLIPCYNSERYIGETLESVLSQTWPNIEVIVVDDGSTDASGAVVEGYFPRGVKLVSQKNSSAAASRNRAFSASNGDYIQFLDADDILSPDKIESQMRRLLASPTSIASAGWARFVTDIAEARFEPESNWTDLDPIEWLVRSRCDGLGMLFPAIWLFHRKIAEAAGPWDQTLSLGDDGEYFTRAILAAKRVLFCEGPRCYYRSGISGSLSGRKSAAAWASQFKVLDLCEQHVRAREDSERVRRGFALSWQHTAHSAYPYDRVLAEKAVERARGLHHVRIKPDGGLAFRTVRRVIGWKRARLLQVVSGRQ